MTSEYLPSPLSGRIDVHPANLHHSAAWSDDEDSDDEDPQEYSEAEDTDQKAAEEASVVHVCTCPSSQLTQLRVTTIYQNQNQTTMLTPAPYIHRTPHSDSPKPTP